MQHAPSCKQSQSGKNQPWATLSAAARVETSRQAARVSRRSWLRQRAQERTRRRCEGLLAATCNLPKTLGVSCAPSASCTTHMRWGGPLFGLPRVGRILEWMFAPRGQRSAGSAVGTCRMCMKPGTLAYASNAMCDMSLACRRCAHDGTTLKGAARGRGCRESFVLTRRGQGSAVGRGGSCMQP